MAKRITTDEAGEQQTRSADAIQEFKQQLYANTIISCKHDIRRLISQGRHGDAWEVICNGPDVAGFRHPRAFNVGDRTVGVFLNGDECGRMRDELRAYAVANGWDYEAGVAEVRRMMTEARGRVAQAAKAMKGRGRG